MESHWGSSQQLRSGKVIADFVNGPGIPKMDPVFGVLLCPYAGKFTFIFQKEILTEEILTDIFLVFAVDKFIMP